jgi:hypothetical protein
MWWVCCGKLLPEPATQVSTAEAHFLFSYTHGVDAGELGKNPIASFIRESVCGSQNGEHAQLAVAIHTSVSA